MGISRISQPRRSATEISGAWVIAVCCAAVLQLGIAGVADAGALAAADVWQGATAPLEADDNAGFEVVWSGIYDISTLRRVDDSQAPALSRGIVLGSLAPVQSHATTRIPAKAGVNFGVAFKFRPTPDGMPVDYRAVWRFPKPGLTNPDSKKTFLAYQSAPSMCAGHVCVYGWSFSEPWETVPGTWTLELWRGNTKLHQQAFEVVRQ